MNHYPNHPRFAVVALFDENGQYINVDAVPLDAERSTDTEAVYHVQPTHQTLSLVPHTAPKGKDWHWDGSAWTLLDDYAQVGVYSKITAEQVMPPVFGQALGADLTLIAPPQESGKIAYWDATKDSWALRPDLTGVQVFDTQNPKFSVVLGRDDLTIPEGYTTSAQPSDAHVWDGQTCKWVLDKIKQAELDAQAALAAGQARLIEIEQAIQSHINQTVVGLGMGFTDDQSLIGKYAGYDNVFRPIAEAVGKWVAEIWYLAGQDKAAIVAGKKAIPTVAEALAQIPVFTLPKY